MLHLITAVKSVVQRAIDSAISAFEQDTSLIQNKMNDVLNPANEAQRQKFRAQILQALIQSTFQNTPRLELFRRP